ncbi:MAG: hypothetical protein DLM54_06480 [Acidimicrobiales bacterium]|nr:MAG: hypothetical protein DLM54_06480 [Acidimicrobiales bacterium]
MAAGSTILGASYWLAGGRVALRPVLALGAAHSRASISTFAANVHPALGAPVFSALVVAAVALAVVLGPRRPPLPLLLGSVLVAYLAGTPYVLPWYVMWALPALALDWRSPVAAMGAVAALGLTVAYLGAPRLHDGFLRMVVHPVYAVALPLFFAASLAWLVARSRQASGRTGPILDTGGSQIGAAH